FGGPQEWARRAGREDVGAALAMATALEVCGSRRKRMAEAAAPPAEGLEDLLERLGGRRTGTAPRLPNFATAAFRTLRGEHVLLAMGLDLDDALGSLRLTLGYETTAAEVDLAQAVLKRVLGVAARA